MDNKSSIRHFSVKYRFTFLLIICILTHPSGSPKYCKSHKNIRQHYTLKCLVKYLLNFVLVVPTKAPTGLTVTATSSTSITASWQLPPVDSRNGIIRGFKLFYQRKGSADSSTILDIKKNSTLTKHVNGLHKYTEYEFQVLAYTVGDGTNSSKVLKTTLEDGERLSSF